MQREKKPRVWQALPQIVAFLCAALMLCGIPLVFHDAFFDINRYKVKMVITVTPWLGGAMLLSLAACAAFSRREAGAQREILRARWARQLRAVRAPLCAMVLLALCFIVTCARAGFEPAVLIGNEGRYAGLWFWLCCLLAFGVIVLGALPGRALMGMSIAAAVAIALLGMLNVMDIDPLQFYARISPGQKRIFLSTIGNFDFYGAYLALALGLAGGLYVFAQSGKVRYAALACAVCIELGVFSSRTDSSFVSANGVCLALVALSTDDLRRLARAVLLWGMLYAALALCGYMLTYSPIHRVTYEGMLDSLWWTNTATALAALGLVVSACVYALARRGVRAPGRRLALRVLLVLIALGVLVIAGLGVYFTWWNPQANLGDFTMLRFDDHWGSHRGFVYSRALQAYATYGWADKCFGVGLDLAYRVLAPYMTDPQIIMLADGVFNDVHSQPLQMLITCGALGAVAFVALYLSSMYTIGRRMRDDPLLCAAFCALVGYGLTMLVNVTQPILITSYLAVCALALSRCAYLAGKEEAAHEP